MRRTPTKRCKSLRRTFPLFFWKLCNNCKQEFRRELGFRFGAGPYFNGIGKTYYLCSTCVPTADIAHEYAKKGPKPRS